MTEHRLFELLAEEGVQEHARFALNCKDLRHTRSMYLRENPVLQRELLVNLRMNREFLLLLTYVALLSAVVMFAWPTAQRLDMSANPEDGKTLVNLIFLEQYLLASLMAPASPRARSPARRSEKATKCCWPARCAPRPSCWASCWHRSRTWQC